MAYTERERILANTHLFPVPEMKNIVNLIKQNRPIMFRYEDFMQALIRTAEFYPYGDRDLDLKTYLTYFCEAFDCSYFEENHYSYNHTITFESKLCTEIKCIKADKTYYKGELYKMANKLDHFKREIYFKIQLSFFLSFYALVTVYFIYLILS